MHSSPPITVRLPKAFALGRRSMSQLLQEAGRVHLRALAAWELSSPERRFAKALLTSARSNLWLWRTDQKRRAGDFVLVDLSSPDVEARPCWVMDLKLGAPIKLGGGGAGIQLQNASLAVRELAAHGVIGARTKARLAVGDGRALLSFFGCSA